MDQQQTFNWLVARNQKLLAIEAAWAECGRRYYWDAPHWTLLVPNQCKEAEKLIEAIEAASVEPDTL